MADLATVEDLEKAWRSLSVQERPRAVYYLGFASRRIRDRWPDVDDRIIAGTLSALNVNDVVVQMVLGVVDGPSIRGAKSFSESAGSMSRSVVLESGRSHLITFEAWMLDILDPGRQGGGPLGSFPKSRGYAGLFRGREEYS